MNILIVDDEISAIEAVLKGIRWEKLEIGSIYTATSKKEAISQIERQPIDLLLSDIEMPMGTGLDLLQWVKAHFPNMKCVFMTCHADFSMLQEALHLGSSAYILKPLDFLKLEQVLESTIMKMKEESLLQENSRSWLQNKRFVVKQFWKDFFFGEISANRASLMNYFRSKSLDIDLDKTYLPVLISTKKWTEPVSKEDQKLLHYALRNIAEEIFVVPGTTQEVLQFSHTSILIMVQLGGDVEEKTISEGLKSCCQQLREAAKSHIKEIVCCYIGTGDTIYEMPSQIELLQTVDFNNVILERSITYLQEDKEYPMYYLDNAFTEWREWIERGKFEQVLHEIMHTLSSEKLKSALTRDDLRNFSRDFFLLIFGFARGHNIFMNELFGDEKSNILSEESTRSLEGMLTWVEFAIAKMQAYEKEISSRNDPVDKTREYINAHLAEEISMEGIAQNVHLNADYLTRIFKKEEGISISKYIINRKIERAKNLLADTNKSIGEIAAMVGYYNYSSFNRVFTKEVSMSPQEYKKWLQIVNP
ncbi:Melibiose operon regulatory protein [compost metagenome]